MSRFKVNKEELLRGIDEWRENFPNTIELQGELIEEYEDRCTICGGPKHSWDTSCPKLQENPPTPKTQIEELKVNNHA